MFDPFCLQAAFISVLPSLSKIFFFSNLPIWFRGLTLKHSPAKCGASQAIFPGVKTIQWLSPNPVVPATNGPEWYGMYQAPIVQRTDGLVRGHSFFAPISQLLAIKVHLPKVLGQKFKIFRINHKSCWSLVAWAEVRQSLHWLAGVPFCVPSLIVSTAPFWSTQTAVTCPCWYRKLEANSTNQGPKKMFIPCCGNI